MSLPPLTIDQAKDLAAGGFGKTILRTAGSYVVPMTWAKSLDPQGVHLTNGTAFFVRTPRAVFGVTAAHVVKQFLQDKAHDPRTVCGLVDSDTEVDLQRDLIDIGRTVDIATFRVEEGVISRLNKQPMTSWPPKTPQIGKGVFYAGFPGQVRERQGPREFSFGLCSGAGIADDVDAEKIVTSIKRDELVDTLGYGLPPEGFEFGGMSGGPLLALMETGIVSWSLAGVIYWGSTLGGGILCAAHATCLQQDGTLSR